jgi:hypothetical protein
MPDQDPYAAIATPISFDDLGGKMVSPPPSAASPGPRRVAATGGIDFTDLGGKRVNAPAAPPFVVPKGAEKYKPANDTSLLRDARTKKVYARAVRDANGKLTWGSPK